MDKLKVRFTEQQLVLLRRLLEEEKLGAELETVCLNVFREYARVLFGMESK